MSPTARCSSTRPATRCSRGRTRSPRTAILRATPAPAGHLDRPGRHRQRGADQLLQRLRADPPLLILQDRPDGARKDTTRNILETGEFVVNLVDEPIARQMVVCAMEFPPDVDEVRTAGLSLRPSVPVRPGWIAEAPAALECRLERTVEYPGRWIVFGEVVRMHVRDACVDPATMRVRPESCHPVARMHGDNYVVAKEWQVLRKMTYEEWRDAGAAAASP